MFVGFLLYFFMIFVFDLYGIFGESDICKMMPRGMPSFLAIGWLILTTFPNSRFSRFSNLGFWDLGGPWDHGPGPWARTMGPWAGTMGPYYDLRLLF